MIHPERIRITITDGVADVRMVRSAAINALDHAMHESLSEAAASLHGNAAVRVVVLSGEGKGFCAGIDTQNLAAAGDGGVRDLEPRTQGIANDYQATVWNWRTLDVPVIAAVHGYAFGGGCQVMLGADVRIAHPDTKISVMEAKYGLVPDMAGIALLRHLVREDVARELTYSGRILDGREAATLGLVTRLADDPYAAAHDMARTWAAGSRDALVAAKRLLNMAADESADAAAVLMAESVEQKILMAGADHREAVLAAREKRPPAYRRG